MENIVDDSGTEQQCLSVLNIKGTDYYITENKKVFIKSKEGKFEKFDFTQNKDLDNLLKEPKIPDVIDNSEER